MKHYVLALLVAIGLLSSCGFSESKKGKQAIEYVPFKESEHGGWGLIGTDGKPLFRDKFKDSITVAKDGRFFAKNPDGSWNLYTAEANPKQIGESYVSIGVFEDGVAPVARHNKPIEFINTDGEVVFTFDKVNGKEVTEMEHFKNGVAPFELSDGNMGVVDTKGNVVLEPRYDMATVAGDRIVALDGVSPEERLNSLGRDSLVFHKGQINIFTMNGKKRGDFKATRFGSPRAMVLNLDELDFSDDKSCFYAFYEDYSYTGVINDRGDWVVRLKTDSKGVYKEKRGKIIYVDDNLYCGLMDYDQKTLIHARYTKLYFTEVDGLLRAVKGDSTNREVFLIDENDNKITKEGYKYIYSFWGDASAFAQIGENRYVLINSKGEEYKNGVDIYDWVFNYGDGIIERQNIDWNAFVEDLKITPDGIGNLSFNQTPKEVLEACNKAGGSYSRDAQNHTSTEFLSYSWMSHGCEIGVGATYTQSICTTQYDNNSNYLGYTFNHVLPEHIIAGGDIGSRASELMKVIKAKCMALGLVVVKQNKNVILGKLYNRGVLIIASGGYVGIRLFREFEDVDIDQFIEDSEGNYQE